MATDVERASDQIKHLRECIAASERYIEVLRGQERRLEDFLTRHGGQSLDTHDMGELSEPWRGPYRPSWKGY